MMVPFKGAELTQSQSEVGMSLLAKCNVSSSVIKVYKALLLEMLILMFEIYFLQCTGVLF